MTRTSCNKTCTISASWRYWLYCTWTKHKRLQATSKPNPTLHDKPKIASKMIYMALDLPKGVLYIHDFNAYYSSPIDGYNAKTVATC